MSDPRWLDADGAAKYLCIRVDAFLRRVRTGIIPSGHVGLGDRTALWWSADLDAVVRGGSDSASTNHLEAIQAYVERMETKGRKNRQAGSR